MKRPTMLLESILRNFGDILRLAIDKDVHTIVRRFEREGMSFLTLSFPTLCDTLDQCLAKGFITPPDFLGFKPWRKGGKLPALLSGFFMKIFETDGRLREDPCPDSIFAIRQVTRLFKKVELPCSPVRIERAFRRYISNDENVFDTAQFDSAKLPALRIAAGYLWSDLEGLSRELYCSPGIFGSGATAERLKFNERHDVTVWNERAEPLFPSSFHCSHDEGNFSAFQRITYLPDHLECPVRVVQVPKTLKAPRTISVEPSYQMLIQQSVAKPLMNWLESGRLGFHSIRFTDQTVNKDLARVGSLDGRLATIDLSDASDLVSNDLVKMIFGGVCPSFLDYLQDSRTRRARVRIRKGEVLEFDLKKFASMGSALCFPVEAMVFLTIILASMISHANVRPSRFLVSTLLQRVAVYGDDIIVPQEMAQTVCDWLEAFGLKVNREKSFWQGLFRESCGGDYYKGNDVTPVYVRHWDFSGSLVDPEQMISMVSLSNQLYAKGLWTAAQMVRDFIVSRRGNLPRLTKDNGGLSFTSVFLNTGLQWCPTYQRYGSRQLVPATTRQPDKISTIDGAMLLSFSRRPLKSRHGSPMDSQKIDGLTSVKPYALKLKRRWTLAAL